MRFRAVLFLVGSIALFAFSVMAGNAEIRPFLQGNLNTGDTEYGLARGVPASGLSIPSQQLALSRCSDAAMSIVARLQPSTVRRPAMENCLTLADTITSASPTYAFAYLVGAMAAEELGDPVGMRKRLALSHRYGPTEQWIAQGRVELAETARLRFGSAGLEFETADLALLVKSLSGIEAIAGRYVSEPAFRSRITDIVESLPERDQQRFVDWVNVAVRKGGQ